MLSLEKPLAFFDLETTGINVATDKIIEISVLKIYPDGNEQSKTWMINPGMPIPAEASAIHGIYDADVAQAPHFKEVAHEINTFLDGCDIAGYNSNKFDIPMLIEEFLRLDLNFNEDRRYVDVMRIFTLMEKRTLEAAYKFFCNKDLENAHSAEADVRATYEVLLGQLERYHGQIKNSIQELHEFTKDGDFVDFARRMIYKNGKEYFNFGKYNGQSVEDIYRKEPQYFDWILNNDFPLHTKMKLRNIKLRLKQQNKNNLA